MYLIIIALLGSGNAEQITVAYRFTLLPTTTDPKLKQNKKVSALFFSLFIPGIFL